jgi:hypothetical protein
MKGFYIASGKINNMKKPPMGQEEMSTCYASNKKLISRGFQDGG